MNMLKGIAFKAALAFSATLAASTLVFAPAAAAQSISIANAGIPDQCSYDRNPSTAFNATCSGGSGGFTAHAICANGDHVFGDSVAQPGTSTAWCGGSRGNVRQGWVPGWPVANYPA
ncbi:hypothetical protein D5S17_10285 [Pseudonocardiaceae bacterium YIM PH 21723]|nr:hypothetical protein D5S17_10285 [Pseudonocardiaceae bacterium YIM PH 21723]